MAACANTVARKIREAEQERLERHSADWHRVFDRAYARFPDELGDGMLLEVVGELGENDPSFDRQVTRAYRALKQMERNHCYSDERLARRYEHLGQIVANWIDHYSRQWAEREADAESRY